MDGKFRRKWEGKLFWVHSVEWERRKINGELHVFSLWTHQKVFSPKLRENLMEKIWLFNRQKCKCLVHFTFLFLFFFFSFLDVAFLFFVFCFFIFWFLVLWVGMLPLFFLSFLSWMLPSFFLFFVWLEVKKWNDKKMSLYKFTHTPLLKNDSQLIQKSDKQLKKKITQFMKK